MFCAVVVAVIGLVTVTIAGPLCYHCDHVTTPADCHKGIQCSDNQKCFTQKLVDFQNNAYYKLGCENSNVCQALPVSLIGKRDVYDHELRKESSRQATHIPLCLECCDGDACNNKGGCGSDTGMLTPTKDPGTGILIPTQKPVAGGWSDWSIWSNCSKSCGSDAFKTRSRTCSNPPPQHGGAFCHGNNTDVTHCQVTLCPTPPQVVTRAECVNIVDGAWASWRDWSSCSASCGSDGIQSRLRSCDNPPPQNDGAPCLGTEAITRSCMIQDCPIDGAWSAWGAWNSCPGTCGTHMTLRRRRCDNPAPQHNGTDCPGEDHVYGVCHHTLHCPAVHGNWSEWSEWSACSHSCGPDGHHTKRRYCNTDEKNMCTGISMIQTACNHTECPVDGQWAEWGAWSSCTHSCGGGYRHKRRNCTNPAPAHGGQHCDGPGLHTAFCNQQVACSENGSWSEWTGWSACDHTCGPYGTITRHRTCDNPTSTNTSADCSGESQEKLPCTSLDPCPVDGQWSDWGQWSHCSNSCGPDGSKSRHRACTNPAPAWHGAACAGLNTDVRSCNVHKHCSGHKWFWIGLYAAEHPAGWHWVDDSLLNFENFDSDHEEHQYQEHHKYQCVVSGIDRDWWSEPCGDHYPFVCEINV